MKNYFPLLQVPEARTLWERSSVLTLDQRPLQPACCTRGEVVLTHRYTRMGGTLSSSTFT